MPLCHTRVLDVYGLDKMRRFFSYLFFPFTMWYAIGVWVRNALFNLGLKKQAAPHITTIGVGNLATGGTGKTPHVEYLLDLLTDKYRVAMLSRGYKRHSRGFATDDGSHDATLLGDEPAMVAAKHPAVQVAVCEKRIEGVERLMSQETPPEVVVLDDVYQHRAITPNINILLTEYQHPFYKDHILPYGDLREFKSARSRAGVVVVTKCPPRLNPVDRHNIVAELRLRSYQKVFFSYLQYGTPLTLDGRASGIELQHNMHVLAVTGIAHPEPMLDELRRTCKVQQIRFADHHEYTRRDVARIASAFEDIQGNNKIILTTEKDAQRLRGLTGDLPIYVLPVRVAFHQENDLSFDQFIEASVRENISFLNKLSIWNR